MRNDCFGRRMSFSLKHRILLRDIDGAGLAQWAGSRTPNPRVPGSIPGRVGVIFSLFLGMSWDVFGSAFGRFSDGPGKKENIEYFLYFQYFSYFPYFGR